MNFVCFKFVGLVVLVLFSFVLLVQFWAMLLHRFSTLIHFLARVPYLGDIKYTFTFNRFSFFYFVSFQLRLFIQLKLDVTKSNVTIYRSISIRYAILKQTYTISRLCLNILNKTINRSKVKVYCSALCYRMTKRMIGTNLYFKW